MQRVLERRYKGIKKNLAKLNTQEEFHDNIDALSNIEIRERYDGKKRSKKLGVRVPA